MTLSLSPRAALAALAAVAVATGCSTQDQSGPTIALAAVERRDIQVDVEATGVVEPINVIEVKSKASGQITQMPVESGDLVQPGALLVQLDTRDVRNQYNQAAADVRAAEASVEVARSAKQRADELFAQRIITAAEHEQTSLTHANAQAQVVRARTNLDLAGQRLEDATVRAPVAGTIIEKLVSLGQVISSATGSVSGGTTLLKMADLNSVRVRALVNETDIGNVRSGQTARVTVDAYPDRPFTGVVEKIEPQAVVQQSVTMFPVLVTIQNREGLLKPGMNGEVAVLIDRRENVLAVPNDAVRAPREVAAAATALGLDPEKVQEQVRAQFAAAGGGGRRSFSSPGAVDVASSTDAGVAAAAGAAQQRGAFGPPPTAEQCTAVRTALRRNPAARTAIDSLRQAMTAGTTTREAGRAAMARAVEPLGLEVRVVLGCLRQEAGGGAAAPTATARSGVPAVPSTGQPGATLQPAPEGAGTGDGRGRVGLVFVPDSGSFAPRVVRLGVSDYDYSEVLGGVAEGDSVALLAAATMQVRRDQQNEQMRSRMGGVPGMQRQTPAAGGSGGGAPRGGGR